MPEQSRVKWSDLVLAAVLVVFAIGGTGPASHNQELGDPPLLAYLLAIVAAASVVMWRWRPWWTFGITGAALVLYMGSGYGFGPIVVIGVVATYGLASRVRLKPALVAVGILLIGVMIAVTVRVETAADPQQSDYLSTPAWVVIPAAVGIAVRIRRESAREVRQAEARTAISEERLRMAQEIHDTVGHGLAVIAMQAGVALHVLDRDPDKTRESLEAIRSVSKHSLDDLRAELDQLRGTSGPAPRYQPSVGLADVPALAERIGTTGLPVSLKLDDGNDMRLPPTVDLAAYRIIQESLTNVLRHAGADASAQVAVTRDGSDVVVDVRDDGRGVIGEPEFGHGLSGMRHRAELLGGTFDAGPSTTGGFRVTARLPMTEPAS